MAAEFPFNIGDGTYTPPDKSAASSPQFLTVHDLVSTFIRQGFADHGMGDFGEAVVQVTWDGEQFYAIDGIIDYGDGGVVLQMEPWPPGDGSEATP